MNSITAFSAAFLSLQLAAAAEPAAAGGTAPATPTAAVADTKCYELRTYHAAEGKMEALQARFRDHTLKLFAKHGITSIGYWVQLDEKAAPTNRLTFLLSYPARADRDASWKAFMADPDWQKAMKESEANGRLVEKVENPFLVATDYSPEIKPAAGTAERTFELRTYTCTTGNLPRLDARFREHTVKLFSKHGMSHIAYWHPDKDQAGAEDTLIYILAHKDAAAQAESFRTFRADPVWVEAKTASEKAAGGSLTVPDGVKSVLMKPTDFSPTK